MTWFDNIYDLQYYHQPKGLPCYCEAVAYPFDMYLQGQIYNGNGSYTLKIYVYSADGNTLYEDATTYFDHYFAKVPGTGTHFFNARLKSYSPAMCAHECYVLRVEVVQSGGVTVFNKYTERYCQNNCCDVPRNITFNQTGFSPLVVSNDPTTDVVQADVALAGASTNIFIPTGSCGEPLLRLITKFDCIDNLTGDFYGTPDVVLSGSADFQYRKITTFRGRLVRRPRDIEREVSYNCKVLQSQSTAQYLLEGFEYMPAWKMYEIEGQLHANSIYVDDFSGVREYRFPGGTVFKQVNKCFELFKLEVKLEDCTQRQIFGCTTGCDKVSNFDGSQALFAIPADYGGGAFYNSSKEMIATDYEGLMNYFMTCDGATGVNDVDTASMNCSAYKVLGVSSTGYIDQYIYYDTVAGGNKVYAAQAGDVNDLCAVLPAICVRPSAGTFSVAIAVCATPVMSAFTVEDIATDVVGVNGYGDWGVVVPDTYASIYGNEVTFSIEVVNSVETEDPDLPGDPVPLGEVIAVIGSSGRPAELIVLNSDNSTLPEDTFIQIRTDGQIYYYGLSTAATSSDVTLQLSNIKYNI